MNTAVAARAEARLRHPAGRELDLARLTPLERRVLLHEVTARRAQLTKRRQQIAKELRIMASELGVIDSQLSDCDHAETFLLEEEDRS